MAVNVATLVNLSSSKGIKFYSTTDLSDNVTINNVSLPIAGTGSNNNFSRNFGGFRRLISVGFLLTNDGTDKSTDSASKITLKEQRQYITGPDGVLQSIGATDKQFDVKYRLTISEDGTTTVYDGSIEDLTIQWNPGNGSNRLSGTLNFFEAGQ